MIPQHTDLLAIERDARRAQAEAIGQALRALARAVMARIRRPLQARTA